MISQCKARGFAKLIRVEIPGDTIITYIQGRKHNVHKVIFLEQYRAIMLCMDRPLLASMHLRYCRQLERLIREQYHPQIDYRDQLIIDFGDAGYEIDAAANH